LNIGVHRRHGIDQRSSGVLCSVANALLGQRTGCRCESNLISIDHDLALTVNQRRTQNFNFAADTIILGNVNGYRRRNF
jgi:hypothetical protein